MNLKNKKIGIMMWINSFLVVGALTFLSILVYNYNIAMNLRNSSANLQESLKNEKSKNFELVKSLDEYNNSTAQNANSKLLGLVLEKSPLYIETDSLKLASQN